MYVDPRLAQDVAKAEGCRLTAYKDTLGNWTIGYGRLLTASGLNNGYTITQAQADAWLNDDLDAATAYAVHLPEWPALDTQARRNAVIECVFNLGVKHWTDEFPKTRAAIQAQDWTTASAELTNSPVWIAQVGSARVERLADYLRSGCYPN